MGKQIEERDHIHRRVIGQIRQIFQVDNLSGVEVFSGLNRIVQLLDILDTRQAEEGQAISGARWRLLLHLFLSEQIGHRAGLTPTELSHFQQVSKNTVSALLRGLEEQGYILRQTDARDLRVFRIHLSDSGRQIMLETAPGRIQALNRLLHGLSPEEVTQLIALLTRLRHNLEAQVCPIHRDEPAS